MRKMVVISTPEQINVLRTFFPVNFNQWRSSVIQPMVGITISIVYIINNKHKPLNKSRPKFVFFFLLYVEDKGENDRLLRGVLLIPATNLRTPDEFRLSLGLRTLENYP